MPLSVGQFLNQFSQQALDNRISLFLGAGGSCDAGYPNWKDLFLPFASELGIPISDTMDYYKLAQYYSNIFGQAELKKRINEIINRNSYKSRLIDELLDVGFVSVWTTNFDNALELNYQKSGILINKIFRDSDFSNIDFNRRINIFKMNGDISNLESLVATQSDYEKYGDSHRIMLMFFKRALISSTFLFLGYSFTDHLVLDCLSEITRYLGDSANYHYTIIKRDLGNPCFNYFIDDIEKRYHVRVLLVDNYEEIPLALSALNQRIKNKRIFISGSFSTFETPIEEYSHSISKRLATALLSNDYRIVNGIGRRFGTHLIGYANEFLIKHGIKNIDRYLIIQPFVGNDKNAHEEKKKSREKIISNCGAAIFVFGEADANSANRESGVIEEFEIAYTQHKVIIPISYPNMASEAIWKIVKDNITQYPYLEGYIHMLTSKQPIDSLINIIIHILKSVQDVR